MRWRTRVTMLDRRPCRQSANWTRITSKVSKKSVEAWDGRSDRSLLRVIILASARRDMVREAQLAEITPQ